MVDNSMLLIESSAIIDTISQLERERDSGIVRFESLDLLNDLTELDVIGRNITDKWNDDVSLVRDSHVDDFIIRILQREYSHFFWHTNNLPDFFKNAISIDWEWVVLSIKRESYRKVMFGDVPYWIYLK